jgi:hypothetical protein
MHWFTDEWRIDENVYSINNGVLFNFIKINALKPQRISFDEIAYKGNIDRDFFRYQLANTNYPMIVSKMQNPYNKKYRLIDGRHRIHKLMDSGEKDGLFYEIPKEFILKWIVKH